jgi:hypothetical protein
VFPKLRPRHEYQEEPDLEAEKNKSDGQKAVHQRFGDSKAANNSGTVRQDRSRIIRLPNFCSLLRSGLDFLDPSRFAAEFTDVIQLGAAHASRANYFNSVDYLRVQRKYTLDSMSKGDLPDSKRCPRATVFLSNANALEDLNALLITFSNLYVDFDRIAWSEIREVRA